MVHPEEGNIGHICEQCADAMIDPKWASLAPSYFLTKHVQLAFPADGGRYERMWVQVLTVKGDQCVGVLKNTPIITHEWNNGDALTFHPNEIVRVDGEDYHGTAV